MPPFLQSFVAPRPAPSDLPENLHLAESWVLRPATAVEGDWLFITAGAGAGFAARYSVAWGDWVPAIAYSDALVLAVEMTGAGDPDTEGWTEFTENGGTITSGGGAVTFDCGTTGLKTAHANFDHGQDETKKYLMSGDVSLTGPITGSENMTWEIHDVNLAVSLSLGTTGNQLTFLNDDAAIGSANDTVSLNATRRTLFLYAGPYEALAFIPSLSPFHVASAARAAGQGTALDIFDVGDNSIDGGGIMTVANLKAGYYP